MRIHVLTIFPEMIRSAASYGIVGRAAAAGLVSIDAVDLREFTHDAHRTTDDTPYGGGGGMIMKAEPVSDALDALRAGGPLDHVILTDPQGEPFSQAIARELAQRNAIAIVCGRYEGVDDRVRTKLCTRALSIGDYVLSGGELPALVIVDAVVRLLPGAVGWSEAPDHDSFENGLLDFPQYTKPREFRGETVPSVLLDGDHSEITEWRRRQQLDRTRRLRPDLWALRQTTMDDLHCLARSGRKVRN